MAARRVGTARPLGPGAAPSSYLYVYLSKDTAITTLDSRIGYVSVPALAALLARRAGEPVDVLVNDKLVAKGEVVVINENFGVRLTEIVNPIERITKLK